MPGMTLSGWFYRLRGLLWGVLALAALVIPHPDVSWLHLLWIFLLVPAAVLRIRARQWIGCHSRGSEVEAPRLVREGPYAHVRHPLYLSNLLAATSFFFLLLPWGWALVFSLLGAVLHGIHALIEEKYLAERFGSAYLSWSSVVPRWLPRRFVWKNVNGGVLPSPFRSARQAFREDRWTWIWWLLGLCACICKGLWLWD